MPISDIPPLYTLLAETPPDKAKFSKGIARAASREEAKLKSKLLGLGFNDEKFVSTLGDIQQTFRDITADSHSLAIRIAQYAESFDKIIIKFCADSSISVEERRTKIKKFIEEADDFKLAASATKDNFTNLIDQFTGFASSFSHWAEAQEAADRTEIEALNKEIADITAKINELTKAMSAIGIVAGLTLLGTAILAVYFPQFVIYGLALESIELVTVAGIAAGIADLMSKRSEKSAKLQTLAAEVNQIESARADLSKVGNDDLQIFQANVGLLGHIWEDVRADAVKIEEWLEKGADNAEYPEYMKDALEQGVQVYNMMAKYLDDYAHGVAESLRR
ncbi:hypothetical protein C8R43DRAFT_1140435 [Mycena crocata]|nr:hypothetical protein C8R43DRAFT_1140435 [Mycena crocata]